MSLAEFLYGIAFITFVIGVGWCLRTNASRGSLITMLSGLALDFTTTIAPPLGCTALKMHVAGSNGVIVFAIIAGVLVWLSGFTLIGLRKKLSTAVFQNSLIGVEVLWFIDYIAFAYGMHVYPLH